MRANSSAEVQRNKDLPDRSRVNKLLARAGLAAVCVIPVADTALSDGVAITVQQKLHNSVQLESSAKQIGMEDAVIGGLIFSQSVALGAFISRRKRLQGVFEEYNEYSDQRRTEMRRPRRMLSTIINAPYGALSWVGEKTEAVGSKISNSNQPKVVKETGKLLVDAGMVNVVGTTVAIMQETGRNNEPVSMARIAKLSGLITVSWLGMLEGIRGTYNLAEHAGVAGKVYREAMQGIGTGFNYLTDFSPEQPMSTPVSTIFLGTLAVGLASSGWNIAKYHEHKLQSVPSGEHQLDLEETEPIETIPISPATQRAV